MNAPRVTELEHKDPRLRPGLPARWLDQYWTRTRAPLSGVRSLGTALASVWCCLICERKPCPKSGLLGLSSAALKQESGSHHRQSSVADICRRGCAIVLANPAAGQHSPILGNHEAKYGDRDMPRSNPSPGLGSRRSPDAPRVRIGFVRVAINWHLANRFAGFSPPRGAPGWRR